MPEPFLIIMSRSSPRGKEMRPCVGQDWDGEVLSRQFEEGISLNAFLRNADRVEGDVNASGLLNHRAGVLSTAWSSNASTSAVWTTPLAARISFARASIFA
jgi:hypothetical protein